MNTTTHSSGKVCYLLVRYTYDLEEWVIVQNSRRKAEPFVD